MRRLVKQPMALSCKTTAQVVFPPPLPVASKSSTHITKHASFPSSSVLSQFCSLPVPSILLHIPHSSYVHGYPLCGRHCLTHHSGRKLLNITTSLGASLDAAITSISRKRRRRRMSLSTCASSSRTDKEQGKDERKWSLGRVLGPAAGELTWWDSQRFAGAVVVRENGLQGPYRMYYYGRGDDMWNMGVKPFNRFLPTGRTGLATSPDGLSFVRYLGHLKGGAIMDPSDNPTDFDCVHIAVSDVHYVKEDKLWLMHYFAGGLDEAVVEGFSELPLKGIKLRPGMATSTDGIHFQGRIGPILNPGDSNSWDRNGVSCPRVLLPSETCIPGQLEGKWVMTYHTRELGVGSGGAGYFSAGLAISGDGKTWQKLGKILSAGFPGSWDENGVSVRHVLRIGNLYAMFYEGSNYKGDFAIGLAISYDGVAWKRDEECGSEPGGPVLRARKGMDVWDNVIVGTPYVLAMEDGSFRMYYLGVGSRTGEETNQGIGLAVSNGCDFRNWRRING